MPSAEELLGTIIADKFEIRRLIGSGGMGAVYEGIHIEIGKRVAIKVLDPEHAKSEDVVARFRREGRAASLVESDHVVQVFDVGHDPHAGLYLVMEYLEGEDLSVTLARDKALDIDLALSIAQQTARGLAKAHAAGVIHRDLKPANIFLCQRDGGAMQVKLVDFGISKLVSQERPVAAITRWGATVGTPQYMSPEQAQGKNIDARTDVWSLGTVLYEMLAGRPAYDMLDNYEQTIFWIVLHKAVPLSQVAPWVPAPLAGLVAKALEHDLDLRIPDCGTFAKIIDELRGRLRAEAGARIATPPVGLNKVLTGISLPPESGRPTKPAPPQPTIGGYEVQTGKNALVGRDSGSLPADPIPSRRNRARSIAIGAFAAVALVSAAVFGVVLGRKQAVPPKNVAAEGTVERVSAERIVDPPVGADKPAPTTMSVAALPSASVSVSASTGSSIALKDVKRTTPGIAPSTSVKAKTPEDQFGGTGVTGTY